MRAHIGKLIFRDRVIEMSFQPDSSHSLHRFAYAVENSWRQSLSSTAHIVLLVLNPRPNEVERKTANKKCGMAEKRSNGGGAGPPWKQQQSGTNEGGTRDRSDIKTRCREAVVKKLKVTRAVRRQVEQKMLVLIVK